MSNDSYYKIQVLGEKGDLLRFKDEVSSIGKIDESYVRCFDFEHIIKTEDIEGCSLEDVVLCMFKEIKN